MFESNISNESEFYTNLIEEFSCVKDDSLKLELLKSNKIREITEIFYKTKDNKFFQEAMQIILSLFDDDCTLPMASTSKDFEDLSQEKQSQLTSILKKE
ncbi:MAG: hypothetical protein P8Y70_15075 [Candidatus Lokiarchaeota archaeon]